MTVHSPDDSAMERGRSLTTTTANGPHSAPGTGLHALESQLIHNPPDDAAQLLPTLGSAPRTGETGPTAFFLAVGSFFPKLDNLAHVNHSRILETRNSEDEREPFACVQKDFATRTT